MERVNTEGGDSGFPQQPESNERRRAVISGAAAVTKLFLPRHRDDWQAGIRTLVVEEEAKAPPVVRGRGNWAGVTSPRLRRFSAVRGGSASAARVRREEAEGTKGMFERGSPSLLVSCHSSHSLPCAPRVPRGLNARRFTQVGSRCTRAFAFVQRFK